MYTRRLNNVIPGGAHTYSRGHDQFPSNAPEILARAKGAYVYDTNSREYLDYGMALRSVTLGYAREEIDESAIAAIRYGNNLTRPSLFELDAAELLRDLIPSVDMVKFTKNGSSSVTAAVKLARAYTGRAIVARCADHPFFSYDDWFISSTPLQRGIPRSVSDFTKLFNYNDINSLYSLVEKYPDQIACVVMEPESLEAPNPGYLLDVQRICREYGIVFVLDEMITGFRWNLRGAQFLYQLEPDLTTFGKAMANGFSLSCVAGRREIMQLGSIDIPGMERVFLLSTTHGAEMCSLAAFISVVHFIKQHSVIEHLWQYGADLKQLISQKASNHGLAESLLVGGASCSPWYATLDLFGNSSLALRTLFMQELLKHDVMMPWISVSYAHGDLELAKTAYALDQALPVYCQALHGSIEKYLDGPVIKPVFRRYN